MHFIQTTLFNGAVPWLWSNSGKLHVKTFMRLDDGQNIFKKTVFLISAQLPGINNALTVTSRELFFKIENKFRGVNTAVVANSVILKPFVRNTASTVAVVPSKLPRNTTKDVNMFILSTHQLVAYLQASQQTVLKITRPSAAGKLFPSASSLKRAASTLRPMATLDA